MFWVLHKVQSDLQLIQIPQNKTIKFFTHDNSTELALVSTKTRDSINGKVLFTPKPKNVPNNKNV